MHCPRASFVDEPGQGAAWQRTSAVLPCGRLRDGPDESTGTGRSVRRGSACEPEHANAGVLAARSGWILRDDQRALCTLVSDTCMKSAIIISAPKATGEGEKGRRAESPLPRDGWRPRFARQPTSKATQEPRTHPPAETAETATLRRRISEFRANSGRHGPCLW